MGEILKKAVGEHTAAFNASCYGGYTPAEANPVLNDSAIALMTALAEEHGQAWLGKVNRYKGDKGSPVWEWDGGLVHNFGADFVVPAYDRQLALLILDRAATSGEYDAGRNFRTLEAIAARVRELGGVFVDWS